MNIRYIFMLWLFEASNFMVKLEFQFTYSQFDWKKVNPRQDTTRISIHKLTIFNKFSLSLKHTQTFNFIEQYLPCYSSILTKFISIFFGILQFLWPFTKFP